MSVLPKYRKTSEVGENGGWQPTLEVSKLWPMLHPGTEGAWLSRHPAPASHSLICRWDQLSADRTHSGGGSCDGSALGPSPRRSTDGSAAAEALQAMVDEAPQARYYYSDLFAPYRSLIYSPGIHTPMPNKHETYRVKVTMPNYGIIWPVWRAAPAVFPLHSGPAPRHQAVRRLEPSSALSAPFPCLSCLYSEFCVSMIFTTPQGYCGLNFERESSACTKC